ncbi:MAG: hypothetical protein LBS89_08320 [Zoogloeaceae bacterium]|jgi:hypothetical protein|nr:hypothetical protein [Zoogloeaceae bacterium]
MPNECKVSLLDCEQEPSDAQLEQLMRDVMVDVRARAALADKALWETLAREVAAAHQRFNLNTTRKTSDA